MVYDVNGQATVSREVFLTATDTDAPPLALDRAGHQPIMPTPPLPSGSLLPASMVLSQDGMLYVVLNQMNALGRIVLPI